MLRWRSWTPSSLTASETSKAVNILPSRTHSATMSSMRLCVAIPSVIVSSFLWRAGLRKRPVTRGAYATPLARALLARGELDEVAQLVLLGVEDDELVVLHLRDAS